MSDDGERASDEGDAPRRNDSGRDDAPAADLRDLPAFSDGRNHSLPGEPEWPVREVAVEYDPGWFVGGPDRVEQPDGSEKKYYWAELSPATVVIAVADGDVLFVEQYRPTVRNTQLELPAGIVERGESYTAAGARELAEETGFAPSSTSLLQEVWCSTGVLRHTRGYVFAEGLEPVDVDHDSNEFLSPRAVPIEEALEVARDPPTNDATLEGLLLAEREGLL
ncbi:NUDIX hydrolase [Halorubrum sp. Ib24]|uniref:NUDIX hydrolase n=1 Tax=Halorubrum sp. Ib24 TaxID=1383850 RepID=UPI000B98B1A1|nr:NUDIX hydrolase [Halorubrum sp. Ib24]